MMRGWPIVSMRGWHSLALVALAGNQLFQLVAVMLARPLVLRPGGVGMPVCHRDLRSGAKIALQDGGQVGTLVLGA